MAKYTPKKIRKKRIYIAGTILCCTVFAVSAAKLMTGFAEEKRSEHIYDEMRSESDGSQAVVSEAAHAVVKEPEDAAEPENLEPENSLPKGIAVPDLEIDFAQLQSEHPDIYAWVYVPNTKISYPVLQSKDDDTYYLNYNLDGTKGYPGCIYTEKLNSKSFEDPLTVIYGHNMKNGTMFSDLHKFEDPQFFNENPYIYIFTPKGFLVYEIYAANKYNNSHLLTSVDTSDAMSLQTYLYYTLSLQGDGANIRVADERLSALDAPDSTRKLLTLSTCTGDKSKRYLVQGVLIYKSYQENYNG